MIDCRGPGANRVAKKGHTTSMNRLVTSVLLAVALSGAANLRAAENLRLNPRLDYSSDSQDGPLITSDHMEKGAVRKVCGFAGRGRGEGRMRG